MQIFQNLDRSYAQWVFTECLALCAFEPKEGFLSESDSLRREQRYDGLGMEKGCMSYTCISRDPEAPLLLPVSGVCV